MSLTTIDAPSTLPSPPAAAAATGRRWLWARVLPGRRPGGGVGRHPLGAGGPLRGPAGGRGAAAVPDRGHPDGPRPLARQESKLDSEVARVTGASSMASRIYTNPRTGVKLSVIVLYGPAAKVYIHAPETCYPKAGFREGGGPADAVRAGQATGSWRSRRCCTRRGSARCADRRHVYYFVVLRREVVAGDAEAEDGGPDPRDVQGAHRRPAGMQEQIDTRDPCNDFLKLLMADIPARIDLATKGPAKLQ